MFTATLGAVDKVQISTASLYGWQADTGMHGQEYSWIGSILSIGMLCGLWPGSYLTARLPIAKFLCGCSLIWSALTLCYAACRSWAPIMVIRFFMGILEAVISPTIMMIIPAFYRKDEQPNRNASRPPP
jgi:MFS transporter, ACS family, allantoate permease